MNKKTFARIAASVLLSATAASAFAAGTNGPKPRCPLGEIPVLKTTGWVCQAPDLKAPGTGAQTMTPSAQPTYKLATASTPPRAKPDLSIANVYKLNSPSDNVDAFKVYVKNSQGVASGPAKMSLASNKGGGEISVPAIAANSGQWVEVSFFQFDNGDRIQLMVDSKLNVAETNENNNNYAFNW